MKAHVLIYNRDKAIVVFLFVLRPRAGRFSANLCQKQTQTFFCSSVENPYFPGFSSRVFVYSYTQIYFAL